MQINKYLNIHKDETIYVLGLGESIHDFLALENKGITIGSNDINKYYPVDYLCCIDKPATFTPERWATIEKGNYKAAFSHLNLPLPNLVNIKFGERFVYNLNYNAFAKCGISPFVSVQVAYWLGAKRIIMYGVDLNTHQAKIKLPRINEAFIQLNKQLKASGVDLINASKNSLIKIV